MILPEYTLVDNLIDFLDVFLFMDRSNIKTLSNKYTISELICEGDESKFAADIYVCLK